uniref:Uncharacterized protein n=1 Tax=Spongospora subterranea TaxID=70186 RepID=A0A0H5RBB7_9EUKA|eukprot:CRZ05759.1 hypothetical protein [Spongospora subterranea]
MASSSGKRIEVCAQCVIVPQDLEILDDNHNTDVKLLYHLLHRRNCQFDTLDKATVALQNYLKPEFSAAALIDGLILLHIASRTQLAQSIAILLLVVNGIMSVEWKPTAFGSSPNQVYRFVNEDAALQDAPKKSENPSPKDAHHDVDNDTVHDEKLEDAIFRIAINIDDNTSK